MTTETISREELKEIAVADLLDLDLDMVEDLQGFILPPKGFYRLTINTSALDKAGETDVVKLGLAIAETLELKNAADTPCEEGATFDQTFFPGFGMQQFKTLFIEIAREQGWSTFRELVEGLAGMEITCTIGHRKDKEDKEKFYPTIDNVSAV